MRGMIAVHLVTCLFGFGNIAHAHPADVIDRFYQVSDGIYRGERPGSVGMAELKAFGIKTVLNIEDNSYAIRQEQEDAAALGLTEISIPMASFSKPKDSRVNRTLEILANPANYPIYIHCKHGEDRTGLVVALFRVEYEMEDPADAYEEMLDLGFHTILSSLHKYYKKRTGFKP